MQILKYFLFLLSFSLVVDLVAQSSGDATAVAAHFDKLVGQWETDIAASDFSQIPVKPLYAKVETKKMDMGNALKYKIKRAYKNQEGEKMELTWTAIASYDQEGNVYGMMIGADGSAGIGQGEMKDGKLVLSGAMPDGTKWWNKEWFDDAGNLHWVYKEEMKDGGKMELRGVDRKM